MLDAPLGIGPLHPSSDEPDNREWALYHLAIGVEHIFIHDMGSIPPVADTLADLVAAGKVTVARRSPTLSGVAYVVEEYTVCMKEAHDYRWIGERGRGCFREAVSCAKCGSPLCLQHS